VSARMEVKEIQEVEEVKEKSGGVAAFFDLDGTLVALPSLERRFFGILRSRREIRLRNYFLWLREAVRLAPRRIGRILQANKMYLRGVQILEERDRGDGSLSHRHKGGHQAPGQASAPPRRNPRWPVPVFFKEAMERVAWHARKGHAIVLLSGTLEPLARKAGRALEAILSERGIYCAVCVFATPLEEVDGRWTGEILGEAMVGEGKERAARRIAAELKLDLRRCYAYGDSASDRWLLGAVGRPVAVNPSRKLARLACMRDWTVLKWEKEGIVTRRHRERRENKRNVEAVTRGQEVLNSQANVGDLG
jgi:HAD superfamily phosphoserine phosphatase-like hydrolase